jgi:hypothetical protein
MCTERLTPHPALPLKGGGFVAERVGVRGSGVTVEGGD